MSLHSALCVFCGVSFSGGPYAFMDLSDDDDGTAVEEEARKITDIILESGNFDSPDEVLPTVIEALDAAREQDIPDGLGHGEYATNTYVAIGYWDKEGNDPWTHGSKFWRIPCGREVQVRRVRYIDDVGQKFEAVITRTEDGEDEECYCDTHVNFPSSPNVVMCERCYYYLEEWLERDRLPLRDLGFPNDPVPLSFPGELYEIVNVFSGQRRRYDSLLDRVDYGGVERRSQERQRFFYPDYWASPAHLQKAIEAGELCGPEFASAMMRDVGAWMFMRPDIWPEPPSEILPPSFSEFPTCPQSLGPIIRELPFDLLLPLCAAVPLKSMLAFSATCKSLRQCITSPRFLQQVLKESVLHGHLRWLSPVDTMPSELSRAHKAIRLWLPDDHPQKTDLDACTSPFFLPEFPRLAFIRACWDSDSMMNRKRQWEIARQFEALWRDYRVNGWLDDYMFFSSRELKDWDEESSQPEHWRVLPLKPKKEVLRRSTSGIFSSDED